MLPFEYDLFNIMKIKETSNFDGDEEDKLRHERNEGIGWYEASCQGTNHISYDRGGDKELTLLYPINCLPCYLIRGLCKLPIIKPYLVCKPQIRILFVNCNITNKYSKFLDSSAMFIKVKSRFRTSCLHIELKRHAYTFYFEAYIVFATVIFLYKLCYKEFCNFLKNSYEI